MNEAVPAPAPRPGVARLALAAAWVALAAAFALTMLAAFGITTDFWTANRLAYLAPSFARGLVLAALVGLGFAMAQGIAKPGTVPGHPRGVIPGRFGPALLAALLLVACAALPDRSGFLGDYLMRLESLSGHDYIETFPQALPLDQWLFGSVLASLAGTANAFQVARGAGLVSYAALLAIAWIGLARTPGWRERIPLGLVLLAGNGLAALFTGYARDTILFVPLTLGLCFSLAERVRRGGPLSIAPECWLAALLVLHRSSLLLVLPWAVATALALARGGGFGRQSLVWKAGLAALLGLAAWLAPVQLRIWQTFDQGRHAAWLGPAGLSQLPMLDPAHLGNVACAVFLLAPASVFVLLLLAGGERREIALDLALLLGWLPLALLVQPQQGVFRDMDVYAGMAITWGFVGVRALDRMRERAAGSAVRLGRLAGATGVIVMLATLLVAADPGATHALVTGALDRWPATPAPTRAQWLDYLSSLAARRGQPLESAEFARRSAEEVPTLLHRARAALMLAAVSDYPRSHRQFVAILDSDSTSVLGWTGYAGTSAATGDTATADRAIARLRQMTQTAARRSVATAVLTRSPEVDPTGRVRAALGLPVPGAPVSR